MATIRPDEAAARSWLERRLGMTVTHHDDGSSTSMFDLRIESQPPQAVEVVSNRSSERRRALHGRRKHLDDQTVADLTRGWRVRPTRHANLRDVARSVGSLVADLEARGIDNSSLDEDAAAALRQRGIAEAHADPAVPAGAIRFLTGMVDVGYAASIDDVPGFVERVLQENPDVALKLSASGLPRRHAVIAISTDDLAVSLVFDSDAVALPLRVPNLPNVIDEVWLLPDAPDARVLRWSRGFGWSHEGRTTR